MSTLAIGIGGATAGFLLAATLPGLLGESRGSRVQRRMRVAARTASHQDAEASSTPLQLFAGDGRGAAAWLRRRLDQEAAALGGMAALRSLALMSLIVLVSGLVLLPRLSLFGPTSAAATAIGVAILVTWFVASQLRRRWQLAFLAGFADAIDLVVRSVRSGIPISEAIRTAGIEIAEPVRGEFRRVSDALDLGIDLKDAMRTAAARVRLPDFDFLVTALVIQRESGGQIADTLENLATILRRRKELRLKVKALTAEGRMSAAIVAAMPIVTTFGMYLLDPSHVGRLLVPGTGQTMGVIALGALLLGLAIVHHMTRARP